MNCPTCGTVMKPLATSLFCPRDCDRRIDPVVTDTPMAIVLRKIPSGSRENLIRFAAPLAWDSHITVGIFSPAERGTGNICMTASLSGLPRDYMLRCDVIMTLSGTVVTVVKNRFGGFSYADVPDATT